MVRLGGNYGSRKRGGGVSTLICAVMDDQSPDDDDIWCVASLPTPKKTLKRGLFFSSYRSFVRIGSGLSFADYIWIRAKPWKTWDKKSPPSFLKTAPKSHDDKGDLYLEPQE